jgi:hypothetical protein
MTGPQRCVVQLCDSEAGGLNPMTWLGQNDVAVPPCLLNRELFERITVDTWRTIENPDTNRPERSRLFEERVMPRFAGDRNS